MQLTLSWITVAVLASTLALGACADDTPATGLEGPTVTIAVAPLTLANVEDICYGLTVYNGEPGVLNTETVWSQAGICSGDFGNGAGGDISYIGTCDASVQGNNYVELVLEEITAGGRVLLDQDTVADGGDTDFENPCTDRAPCTLDFACIENGDVSVPFNLTVMRDANQGFFDVAVDFDDIFCSAKLDTCYPGEADAQGQVGADTPITLLYGFETDASTSSRRGHTAVMALACTAGPSAGDDTTLYMTSVVVDCGAGGTFTLDPSAGPGNAMTAGTFDSGAIWQYAVYEGQENLNCGATSCDKVYWNIALGIEGLPPGCSLQAYATASDGALANGAIPRESAYPVIAFDVALTDDAGVICQQNPINGDGSGVTTVYSPIGQTDNIPYELTQEGGTNVDTHAVVITDDTIETATVRPALGKGGLGSWSDEVGGAGDDDDWSVISFSGGNSSSVTFRCSGGVTLAVTGANVIDVSPAPIVCDGAAVHTVKLPQGDTSGTLYFHVTSQSGQLAYTIDVANANSFP